MSLGFEAAGGHCIGAADYNVAAIDTFANMFQQEKAVVFGGPEEGDVQKLSVEKLRKALPATPDVIVGGPPCQGFSRVGRAKQASLMDEESRAIHGGIRDPERNLLYRSFLNMCKELQPKAFVMENVPGMRNISGVDMASRIAREAASCGYNVRYFLLNASAYGVPQHRWRLFFVGLSKKFGPAAIPEPPVRTHDSDQQPLNFSENAPRDPWMICGKQVPQSRRLKPVVTVRDAIHDLPSFKEHLQEKKPQGLVLPVSKKRSQWVEELSEWPGRPAPEEVGGHWYRYTPRDFKTFMHMDYGDCYPKAVKISHRLFKEELSRLRQEGRAPAVGSEAYEELKAQFVPPYRNDAFDEKWKKLVPNQPSWTLTAHLSRDSYSHIHYSSTQARTITIREAARLQSFPDSFNFSGNYGDQLKQIGNAVPPILARALATQLFKQLKELSSD